MSKPITFEAEHPETKRVHRWEICDPTTAAAWREGLWFLTQRGLVQWGDTQKHCWNGIVVRDLGPVEDDSEEPAQRLRVGDFYKTLDGAVRVVRSVQDDADGTQTVELGDWVKTENAPECSGLETRLKALENAPALGPRFSFLEHSVSRIGAGHGILENDLFVLQAKVDKIGAIESRLDELRARLHGALDLGRKRFDSIDSRLAALEKRVTELDADRDTAMQEPGDPVEYKAGMGNVDPFPAKATKILPAESPLPEWVWWPDPRRMILTDLEMAKLRGRERICAVALDSRPGFDPIRAPERARDVLEAARRWADLNSPKRTTDLLKTLYAFERAQRGE